MLEFLGAAAATFVLCWVWVGGYVADLVIWLISKLTPQSSSETNLAYAIAAIFTVLGIIAAATTSGTTGSVLGGAIVGAGAYIAVRLPGKIRGQREARAEKLGQDRAPAAPFVPTAQLGQAPGGPFGQGAQPAPAQTPGAPFVPAGQPGQVPGAPFGQSAAPAQVPGTLFGEGARPVPLQAPGAPFGQGANPVHAQAPDASQALRVDPEQVARPTPQPAVPPVPAPDPRTVAWAEVHNPSTSAARLGTIAAEHPEFGAAILAHPNVYPDLRTWIEQRTETSMER